MKRSCLQRGAACVMIGAMAWGCAAHEALRDGRAALATDNPVAAARHFETALARKPSLAQDERFMADLTRARRDAAMTRGREFLGGKRFDQAIAQFERAQEIDPAFGGAPAAIARARAAAAEHGYESATADADRGDLAAARRSLQQGLAHDPGHAASARALRLLDDHAQARPEALSLWEQASALAAVRDWDPAAERLDRAIPLDPDFLAARALRAEAKRTIAQAQDLLDDGRARLSAREFHAAADLLTRAAELRPHDAATAAALTEARKKIVEAQAIVDDAAAAMLNGEFDAALETIARARGTYPSHPELAALEDRTRAAAASEHTERGSTLLAEGDTAGAQAAFTEAMRYRHGYEPARAGLASLATTQARAAAADGWWGSALLYHLDAVELVDAPPHRDAVTRARDQVISRAGAAVQFSPARDRRQAEQFTIEERVAAALRRDRRGGLLRLVDRGGEEPHFDVTVTITHLSVQRSLVTSVQRSHPYQVEHPAPNPDLPALRQAVWEARGNVRQAERYARDRREAYDLAQHHARDHAHSEQAQRKLRNRREEWDDARDALDRAESTLRRAEWDLSSAPPIVVAVHDASWPYVEETHRLDGRLVARVEIAEGDGDGTIASETITLSFDEKDGTIRGGNPALGLPDDPLQLPDERSVRNRLIAEASDEAAALIAERVLGARVVAAENRSRDAAQRGDPTLVLEAEVDAAIVLGGLNKDAGARRLDALRRESAQPDPAE